MTLEQRAAQLTSVNEMNDKLLDLNRGLTVEAEALTDRAATMWSMIQARDARIVELEAAVRACDAALGKIVEETKYYEQSHLRRVWKLAREARADSKAALDGDSK
jgi:hypothetical protein